MKNTMTAVLMLILLLIAGRSFAEPDDDITRSLTLGCHYSDYKKSQLEAISIKGTDADEKGEIASTKIFQRGNETQDVIYIVKPSEVAECIFPSGHTVRVKVGEESARAYGMCGGDPIVFASIWVNKRKIASRVWFAGHCKDFNKEPDVSFDIYGYPTSMRILKCHTQNDVELEANEKDPKPRPPLSVCVDYPEITRFPRDPLEYPLPNQKIHTVGEIQLLTGSHAVCKAALEELKADFYTFGHYPDPNKTKLNRPDWSNSTMELPKGLEGSSESIFDFDNDGKLDRVFSRDFEMTYMNGSVLLIQPGNSSSKLSTQGLPTDKSSWFIPCQLDSAQPKIQDCPTFSQKNDEAGFSMPREGGKSSIFFRARYTTLAPFFFRGESFVGVSSQSGDTENFVAILKPMPNKKFQRMCLFKQVTENF